MSIWDAFIDDYEHRRKNLLKRIQLMEARLLRTGNSELGRWITTTADSLAQAKGPGRNRAITRRGQSQAPREVCRIFLDTYAHYGDDGTSFGYSHIA